MDKNNKYKILEKSGPVNSVVSLTLEIDKDFVEQQTDSSIRELGEEIEIDGFRKGKAPKEKVLEKVGEIKVLERNVFKAINLILPVVIEEEKYNVIIMPGVTITKIAPKVNPEIKVELTLMPEVELADYKKIAKEIEKPKEEEITDTEVEEYINHIRKNKSKDGNLPEVDEEFIKSLGEFKSVEDFKKQIKENLSIDKKMNSHQKRRIEIMEKIIKDSKIQMPDILIEEEKERMLNEFKAKVESFKMNFEDYLKEIKKTAEELKEEWKADSEKRAKMNLILPKIAREENLKVTDEEIDHEVKHLREHYQDIDEHVAKIYVANVLTNQKVFDFLDNL